MGVKPILFSGAMIRALQSGAKSQTRRVLKPQPEVTPTGMWHVRNAGGGCFCTTEAEVPAAAVDYLPICEGDVLWVREAWSHTAAGVWSVFAARLSGRGGVIYRADDDRPGVGWFPSIHMPREFSRLTLLVSDVRVQRLQEISEDDAVAEGIDPLFSDEVSAADPELVNRPRSWKNYLWHGLIGTEITAKQSNAWPYQFSDYRDPRESYASLWESINGPGSWDANPFVGAYTFSVHRQNVDRFLEARHDHAA